MENNDQSCERILAAQQAEQAQIAAAHPRSSHWPAVRKAHLNVHHKKPYHLFPELELDPTNLITLCENPVHNDHFLFGHLLAWVCWNSEVDDDVRIWRDKIASRR